MENEIAKESADAVGIELNKFMGIADKVIGLANHSATEAKREAVSLAFLYASARYSVFVWQTGDKKDDQEAFIASSVKRFEDMLREQLGDPKLKPAPKPASPA